MNTEVEDVNSDSTGRPNNETDDINSPTGAAVDAKRGWFPDNRVAKGFILAAIGQGSVQVSAVFLSTSLLYLAAEAAGCVDEDGNRIADCNNRVYGFVPASLIANVNVIQGLLAALTMPIIGAIIDFTPHRKKVGIVSAAVLVLIQTVQIGTVSATWLAMAILQAIAAYVLEIQYMASTAYAPELAVDVGTKEMTIINRDAFLWEFFFQSVYLVSVAAVGTAIGFNVVQSGQLGQALFLPFAFFTWVPAWKNLLPVAPPRRDLPAGHKLLFEGFRQNWRTFRAIQKNYKRGLRWFFLMTMFAEAGTTSLMPLAVTYMTDTLLLSSNQVAITFFSALLFSLPGAWLSGKFVMWTNPSTTLKISMVMFIAVTTIASFLLTYERRDFVYIFSSMWGICFGVYYAVQRLFFSLCLPQGQETEFTGILVYCQKILSWLPPLVFSIMIESGVEQRYGLLMLNIFQFIGLVLLSLASSWDEILEEGRRLPAIQEEVNINGNKNTASEDEVPTN